MKLQDCSPFVRTVQLQHSVLEGTSPRRAYDHRIFYILKGEGSLLLENSVHSLQPDTMLFIPPGIGYHFKGRMQVVVINFDLTRAMSHRAEAICPPPAAEFNPNLLFDTTLLEEAPHPLILPDRQLFREELLRLVKLYRPDDPFSDAVSSALVKKLMAELFLLPLREDPTAELIRQVERHIELYAADLRNNEQLAEAFGYHPVYLAALFNEKTGRTLHRAILDRRLELACQFLSRTDNPIEVIALDTGFSSRSHFCTTFKAQMGCTPLQYRRGKK